MQEADRDSGYYNNCHSPWYRWGRWVLAGILILLGLILLAFVLYVLSLDFGIFGARTNMSGRFCGSRRRRRNRRYGQSTPMATQQPIGGHNQGHNNQQYGAPPGPPPTYGNAGYDGYYGQQGGVTQPANTYKP
jgi:hypothetical protein